MNKEQKGGGEIIKAGSVKLDFWQKFNVVAGMVCLAVMPVALVLMVNPGFRFSFSIQLVAYIVVLIAYCAWFFTAQGFWRNCSRKRHNKQNQEKIPGN